MHNLSKFTQDLHRSAFFVCVMPNDGLKPQVHAEDLRLNSEYATRSKTPVKRHEYSTPWGANATSIVLKLRQNVATPKEHALSPMSIAQRRAPEKARKQSTSLDTRDDDMPCEAYMQFRPALVRPPWSMRKFARSSRIVSMTSDGIAGLAITTATGNLCGEHNCRLCMAAKLQSRHVWQRRCSPWQNDAPGAMNQTRS